MPRPPAYRRAFGTPPGMKIRWSVARAILPAASAKRCVGRQDCLPHGVRLITESSTLHPDIVDFDGKWVVAQVFELDLSVKWVRGLSTWRTSQSVTGC